MKWTVVLLVLACTANLLAQNDSEAAARTKVIALEKAWNQAYKVVTRRPLGSLLDDAIVLIQDDRSMQSKAEFLAGMKSTTANEEQVAPES